MAATMMISSVAMEKAGLQMLCPDDDGKMPCPVCLCAGPEFAERWINGAADTVKEMAEELRNGPIKVSEVPPAAEE